MFWRSDALGTFSKGIYSQELRSKGVNLTIFCVCVRVCVCVCVLFLCVCFVCLFWGPFYVVINSPVNMPDSIRKHFGYRQLWPLQPAGSQIQAGSYI